MTTESKPEVAGVAELGRTAVTLVVLISLTITGIMSGVALTVWSEVTYTRTRLDQALKEQRELSTETLRAVRALQADVDAIKRELEQR